MHVLHGVESASLFLTWRVSNRAGMVQRPDLFLSPVWRGECLRGEVVPVQLPSRDGRVKARQQRRAAAHREGEDG